MTETAGFSLTNLPKCQKGPTLVSNETYYSVERDLLCDRDCLFLTHSLSSLSHTHSLTHALSIELPRCFSVKRDLLQCQNKPTLVSNATYYSVKRDLL